MKPPIFYDDNGDLSVFKSVKSAELYLEPEDMDDPRRRIYDSDGRLLGQTLVSNKDWLSVQLGTEGRDITLFVIEEEPAHSDELAVKLRRFLTLFGHSDEQLLSEPLHRLVELCLPYAEKY